MNLRGPQSKILCANSRSPTRVYLSHQLLHAITQIYHYTSINNHNTSPPIPRFALSSSSSFPLSISLQEK
ncbi:hypothetical protein P8452_01349 [Trifolium repens]|nr:hypothetical protein P8452_01349 [Trifolium repens]